MNRRPKEKSLSVDLSRFRSSSPTLRNLSAVVRSTVFHSYTLLSLLVLLQLGAPVVTVQNLGKEYKISGRDDPVVALRDVTLSTDTEFYPVHEREFVMVCRRYSLS
jgi:hypothetical protein